VHARIAVLHGLSPRENRTVPPLRYDDVYRLKADFPHLVIVINGGITSLEQTCRHLAEVDGVMMGRAAYDHPFLFAAADRQVFGDSFTSPTRRQVLEGMLAYLDVWDARGLLASQSLRHLLGLFAHQRVAKMWKRFLSAHIRPTTQAASVLREVMPHLPDDILDASA
jgi:tRNA-dihydrouridine synthase A